MSSTRKRSAVRMAHLLAVLLLIFRPATLHGGENIETISAGKIIDAHWDRRFYDGTAGYDGFIKWYHNPANIRAGLNQTTFQNAVQAGFDAWNAVDSTFGINPLVPIASFQGTTSATDAAAVDGINAIVWYMGSPSGTLASTPCTMLTSPATTQNGGSGNTVLPIGGGMTIPFPGPIGATYPAGTIIDCGIRFDNQDNWVFGAVSGGIDVQSVATHEEGHFLGLSHSTVGGASPVLPSIATMAAFAFSNNTDFRSLYDDDIASAVRTYSRVNGLSQTTGGRARIIGTLKKNAGCSANATGVSVRAYLASQGLHGANAVETFSGSQFRQGLAGEPFNGSFELNVQPGGPYTIYARTFESGGNGFYLAGRYNDTTYNSNTLNVAGASQAFDNLAAVASISAGQTVDLGTVGILGCIVNQPPTAVSVTPSSGSGSGQTFSYVYSDPNGFGDINWVQTLMNGSQIAANGCYTHYYRGSNQVWLLNDAANGWFGPATLGTATVLQNSQCAVDAPNSFVSGVGSSLTLKLALSFKAGFAGPKTIFSQTQDLGALGSGWQSLGNWMVTTAPAAISATPSPGSGSAQVLSFLYYDPNGFNDIDWVQTLMNGSQIAPNGCYTHHYRGSNQVWLLNDTATGWFGPATLGPATVLQNSQCVVYLQYSSVVNSSGNLTLKLALGFKPAFAGSRTIFMQTQDLGALGSGWQSRGNWNVNSGSAPIGVSPSSGVGSTQTFSFQYYDPNGFNDVNWVQQLFNTDLNAVNGCYTHHFRGSNQVWLLNDSADGWLGPVTLGTAVLLQNSQCSLEALNSSVAGSGNDLTLNLRLTFKAAFSGAKTIFMQAQDMGASGLGWQARGTWTAP